MHAWTSRWMAVWMDNLTVVRIDGDETNHVVENLQMLCLNCYYQQTGNPYNEEKETYWNYNLLE